MYVQIAQSSNIIIVITLNWGYEKLLLSEICKTGHVTAKLHPVLTSCMGYDLNFPASAVRVY